MAGDDTSRVDALSSEDELLLKSIPPAPREVPGWFRRKQLFGATVIFGAAFAALGIITFGVGLATVASHANTSGATAFLALGIVFALAGSSVFRRARRTGKRHIHALERGVAAVGSVTSSEYDTSVAVNDRNPWKITYVFFVDEVSFHGSLSTWNIARAETIAKGAHVGVVYLEDSPKVNCLYPAL